MLEQHFVTLPPPLDAWRPLSVAEVATFAPMGVTWWVAGGWAIDLFLGRQTRAHQDFDVALLRRDHHSLRRLEQSFALYIAHDGELMPWDGAPLNDVYHQFWMHRHGDDFWACEVLLEEAHEDAWMFRRKPEISIPIAEFGELTANGIPFVTPTVALLYKSNRHETDRNAADFRAALPALNPGDRRWLRAALETTYGTHPWLAEI